MRKPGGKMEITCFYFLPGWKVLTFAQNIKPRIAR